MKHQMNALSIKVLLCNIARRTNNLTYKVLCKKKCKLLRTNPFYHYTISRDQAKTRVSQATKFLLSIFQVPTLSLSREIIGETSNQPHPCPRHGKGIWCISSKSSVVLPETGEGWLGGLDGLSGSGSGAEHFAQQSNLDLKDLNACYS